MTQAPQLLDSAFRLLGDASPVAATIAGWPDGRILEANDAFLHMHGLTRGELIGNTSAALGLWVNPLACQQMLLALGERGTVDGWSYEYRHRSGRTARAVLTAKRVQVDGQPHLISFVSDVRALDGPASAQADTAQTQRSLFDNALNGIAYCRMVYEDDMPVDFIYLQVNAAFGQQTGLTDVVGRRVSALIPGIRESDPELFEIYGRVARTGRPECRRRSKSEPLSFRSAPTLVRARESEPVSGSSPCRPLPDVGRAGLVSQPSGVE